MGARAEPVTETFRCWCGAPIRASGVPALGVAVLRHGADPHPLGLSDDRAIALALAGDPAPLRAPKVRAWLRGHHPAP